MKASELRHKHTLQSLREFYNRVIGEPMPSPFRELLKKLDDQPS